MRQVGADLQRVVGVGLLERLRVGVDGDELDARDLGLDHAVDRVDAGAADADDAQLRRADRLGRGRVVRRGRAAAARGGGLIMFSGRSEENAWRRRSCGVGTRGAAASRRRLAARRGLRRLRRSPGAAAPGGSSPRSPSCGRARPVVPRACSPACRYPFESTSFASWRYASAAVPFGFVLEHRHALDGSLREADGLPDPRAEHAVAEVLLEDLDRLLGVRASACRPSSAGCPRCRRPG